MAVLTNILLQITVDLISVSMFLILYFTTFLKVLYFYLFSFYLYFQGVNFLNNINCHDGTEVLSPRPVIPLRTNIQLAVDDTTHCNNHPMQQLGEPYINLCTPGITSLLVVFDHKQH